MFFKDYMLNVWRPMQQQAQATGRQITPQDISTSMQQYLAPRLSQQVGSEAQSKQFEHEGRRLDLSQRGADLQSAGLETAKSQYGKQKQLAPWAMGLEAGNLGLTTIQGFQEKEQARKDRATMAGYMGDFNNLYRRSLPKLPKAGM